MAGRRRRSDEITMCLASTPASLPASCRNLKTSHKKNVHPEADSTSVAGRIAHARAVFTSDNTPPTKCETTRSGD